MQRKALLEGKACSITFHLEKNQYVADRMYTLSSGVHFGVPAELLGPPSNPVSTISRPITWPENKITFYPEGSIKDAAISAGAVYLTNKQKSIAYALTCDASCVSHLRRYRYQEKWVLLSGIVAFVRVATF